MGLSLLNPLPDQQQRIKTLEQQLTDQVRKTVDAEARAAKAESEAKSLRAGMANLKIVLAPLYKALGMVFGELTEIGIDTPSSPEPVPSKVSAVWNSWKSKLGEGPSKIIDALLTHGELNTQQLAVVTGYHRTTVPAHIHKMNKAGLLNKNGGRFSLKQL